MRYLLAFLLLLPIAAPAGTDDQHRDHDRDSNRRDDWCYNFRRGYEGCPNDAYDKPERPNRYDYQGRNDRDRGYEDGDDE